MLGKGFRGKRSRIVCISHFEIGEPNLSMGNRHLITDIRRVYGRPDDYGHVSATNLGTRGGHSCRWNAHGVCHRAGINFDRFPGCRSTQSWVFVFVSGTPEYMTALDRLKLTNNISIEFFVDSFIVRTVLSPEAKPYTDN